jgi:hypothetical protein
VFLDALGFEVGCIVLTEQQIQRSFHQLFQTSEVTIEQLEKAESLIDQLRLESPLRHRLSEELEELRDMCLAKRA